MTTLLANLGKHVCNRTRWRPVLQKRVGGREELQAPLGELCCLSHFTWAPFPLTVGDLRRFSNSAARKHSFRMLFLDLHSTCQQRKVSAPCAASEITEGPPGKRTEVCVVDRSRLLQEHLKKRGKNTIECGRKCANTIYNIYSLSAWGGHVTGFPPTQGSRDCSQSNPLLQNKRIL